MCGRVGEREREEGWLACCVCVVGALGRGVFACVCARARHARLMRETEANKKESDESSVIDSHNDGRT